MLESLKSFFSGLHRRLLFYFFLFSLLPLLGLSFVVDHYFSDLLVQTGQQRVKAVHELKMARIDEYFAARLGEAGSASVPSPLLELFSPLRKRFIRPEAVTQKNPII